MTWICQDQLPEDMRIERPLPGVQPLDMARWLVVDEVYGAQMRERLELLKRAPDLVMAQTSGSEAAILEAKDLVIEQIQSLSGFSRQADMMLCPDGRVVALDQDPLTLMGALIQEDICILEKPDHEKEHFLTAAILCFPAHWTLSEKIGHPMGRIHEPVAEYDLNIQRRVQRLFDGVQVGHPLWRFNRANAGPSLYQPRLEKDFGTPNVLQDPAYLRSERQSLIRLPKSKAVIFSIHTYVIAPDTKKPEPSGRA